MIPALHATLARLTTCCHRKTPAVSADESPNQLALATISTSTVSLSSVPIAFRAIAAETAAKAIGVAANLAVTASADSDNLERNLDRMIRNIRTSGIWNEEGGDIAPFAMMSMLRRPLLILDAKHSDHDRLLRTADMSRQLPIILSRSCYASGSGFAHYAAVAPIPFRGGWKTVSIRHDGDCFYRALIAARDQRQDKDISSTEVQTLRQQLADYIAAHRADYLPFAAQDNMVDMKRAVSDKKMDIPSFALDRKVTVPWMVGV